ncbi:MAG TPA: response regulator transcription factor [Thermoanaerobaculia bacterium]|nr:response regulator transcription factor [Thermoanaerobaculia bacterium]
MKRLFLSALGGGVLIAVLKLIEYKHFVQAYPGEIYGGLIALIFTAVGIWLGRRWTAHREVVAVREAPSPLTPQPFAAAAGKVREAGLTPREHEILILIAQGLSNREIAETLFVSENTVKTHSSRVFEKLGVNRRVQAVQKGRELGLVP